MTAQPYEAFQPIPTVAPPAEPPPGWTPAAPSGPSDGTDADASALATPAEARSLRIELAVVAFAFTLPSLLQGFHGISEPTSISTDVGVLDLLTQIAGSLGPAALVGYLLWRDGRLRTAGFGRRSAGFVIGYGALGFVCCFLALLTVGVGIGLARGLPDPDEARDGDSVVDDQAADVPLTFGSLAAAAGLSLAAGIAEETVFRAYAITRLEQAGLRRTAIWAPWAVFTMLHLYQGPIALLVIGAIAAVFTWLFRWKRSVYPGMLAHALYDMSIFTIVAVSTGVVR